VAHPVNSPDPYRGEKCAAKVTASIWRGDVPTVLPVGTTRGGEESAVEQLVAWVGSNFLTEKKKTLLGKEKCVSCPAMGDVFLLSV